MSDFDDALQAGAELSESEIHALCDALFDESHSVEHRAGWLRALAMKGETPGEIAGFVRRLLGKARPFPGEQSANAPFLDVCGTGGDKLGLFNISTAVMFVVSACGARVVKHGNRGITSKSGGADCLEAAGVKIDLTPERSAELLDVTGCVFLFAPNYHPTFRAVAPVRQALASEGVVTIFNKLGPLLNPAHPRRQLSGVYQEALVPLYANVFRALGREKAWAVHGRTAVGGMDEMSTLGACVVAEVGDGGTLKQFEVDAMEYGIERPDPADLKGGDADANAATLEQLLGGTASPALTDIVSWNASAALVAAGIADSLGDGLRMARSAIADGGAAEKLRLLRVESSRTA